ncbi:MULTISPECIES: 2-amino-4-hydroxy-6-hydroxymethyldihydropteridine diphosphokinase [Alteromonadaceae]|uniref:2-amino-4-hydroxy-6- hydroxymethyldihydropteridine diphosphokinase n=1 Tax=Alteromonadaceae TaxID=72275 RepID=UPI001C08A5D0|nr:MULTISPECIES: 2-amino-4-hydroxy-6-hydroxymethyldihydropteridine diphosphokinase [Aliiglaciecola]MBU2877266.1 2-amino-4-hydroxy-6-hydroxymethyldihydropteridine diphosphokinase [Aliiglaciecola lipolytica]MDO6712033.1 2-amino-4-hydroxy-6-hydroxymethyldihydropteridine diphosphokinase [Aliiglaciecola sp. 2_MG-2023]MDO6753603.1 2-amino-4-hydroxy-6-hydroxymethyldihydropteridine diphosphokinase [Aliiglaciecola sp. 1_MG-2023]
MLHQIYISIGSNVERDKYTRAGLNGLFAEFGELTLSNVYESEAVGFSGSHFYNMVVGAKTCKSVQQVCEILKSIENDNGRVRGEKKFAPRTLDLDLLLFDDVVTEDGVVLPRHEIDYNAFVLIPLSEIAGDVIHPVHQISIAAMLANYDQSQQKLWTIEFNWSPATL